MIVNKEFVNFISFTQWVKKFLNFKPQPELSVAQICLKCKLCFPAGQLQTQVFVIRGASRYF